MLPVTLTQAAREQIRALGRCLRLSLEEGGCCGRTYAFGLFGQPADLVFTEGDLILRMTSETQAVLAGATLDYGARLTLPRFRVLNNPNTPQRCACNRSFGQPFPGKSTPHCRAYCPMPWHKEANRGE